MTLAFENLAMSLRLSCLKNDYNFVVIVVTFSLKLSLEREKTKLFLSIPKEFPGNAFV